MTVPQPGDWADWQQVPHGCTCHWSAFRERQPAGQVNPRFVDPMLPRGVWRYAIRDPDCPWHGHAVA